jgi:hypothetical protein
MPEGRKGRKDTALQRAYLAVYNSGTYYVSRARIEAALPSRALKFRYKRDNIAGLQLADLIAHPSHMIIRKRRGQNVTLGAFAERVREILMQSKYDRSAYGQIDGYGIKWLP